MLKKLLCVFVQPTFVSWQECSVLATSAARVSFVSRVLQPNFHDLVFHVDQEVSLTVLMCSGNAECFCSFTGVDG
jgi:hypothetical protein